MVLPVVVEVVLIVIVPLFGDEREEIVTFVRACGTTTNKGKLTSNEVAKSNTKADLPGSRHQCSLPRLAGNVEKRRPEQCRW